MKNHRKTVKHIYIYASIHVPPCSTDCYKPYIAQLIIQTISRISFPVGGLIKMLLLSIKGLRYVVVQSICSQYNCRKMIIIKKSRILLGLTTGTYVGIVKVKSRPLTISTDHPLSSKLSNNIFFVAFNVKNSLSR